MQTGFFTKVTECFVMTGQAPQEIFTSNISFFFLNSIQFFFGFVLFSRNKGVCRSSTVYTLQAAAAAAAAVHWPRVPRSLYISQINHGLLRVPVDGATLLHIHQRSFHTGCVLLQKNTCTKNNARLHLQNPAQRGRPVQRHSEWNMNGSLLCALKWRCDGWRRNRSRGHKKYISEGSLGFCEGENKVKYFS